jgi:hypothetical protein
LLSYGDTDDHGNQKRNEPSVSIGEALDENDCLFKIGLLLWPKTTPDQAKLSLNARCERTKESAGAVKAETLLQSITQQLV